MVEVPATLFSPEFSLACPCAARRARPTSPSGDGQPRKWEPPEVPLAHPHRRIFLPAGERL